MPSQGAADGPQRLRVPVAAAARPQRDDRRARRSATPTGSACASTPATRSRSGAGSSASAASWSPSSTTSAGSSRAASTRPSSCPPPTARSRSSRASSSTSTREVHDPALRAVVEAVVFSGPARRRVPPRALHARRPPRLPRRAARAHGRGRDPGRRDLRASPAARLRPADGGGDRSTTSAGRASSPTAPSSGSARRGGCSATWRSAPRSSAPRPRSLPAERRLALLNCVLSHHGPDAGPGPGAAPAARGFASAEALALYRLNALDASVKGALEHGRLAGFRTKRLATAFGRLERTARRKSCPATTSSRAAKPSSSARCGDGVREHDPDQHPERRERADDQPVADADVAEPVLAPGADERRPGRSRAARSPRRGAGARRGRSPAPGRRGSRRRPRASRRPRRRRIRAAPRRRTPSADQELDRDDDQQRREQQRDRALGEPLLERRAGDHAADRRDADQHALEQVDVAVQALRRSPQARRSRRSRQARPGRLALAVGEPEDQQRARSRVPPPTPNRPLKAPAAVPITASFRSRSRGIRRDTTFGV